MNTLSLGGELTFQTVMDKREAFLQAIADHKEDSIVISMKAIEKADSAGLALMLEGVRFANRNQVALNFQDVPKQLAQMAKFCCVDELLGFK